MNIEATPTEKESCLKVRGDIKVTLSTVFERWLSDKKKTQQAVYLAIVCRAAAVKYCEERLWKYLAKRPYRSLEIEINSLPRMKAIDAKGRGQPNNSTYLCGEIIVTPDYGWFPTDHKFTTSKSGSFVYPVNCAASWSAFETNSAECWAKNLVFEYAVNIFIQTKTKNGLPGEVVSVSKHLTETCQNKELPKKPDHNCG